MNLHARQTVLMSYMHGRNFFFILPKTKLLFFLNNRNSTEKNIQLLLKFCSRKIIYTKKNTSSKKKPNKIMKTKKK